LQFLEDQRKVFDNAVKIELTAFLPQSVANADSSVAAVANDSRIVPLDPELQARAYLLHALLNHNDFVTVR